MGVRESCQSFVKIFIIIIFIFIIVILIGREMNSRVEGCVKVFKVF